ncbi:MAG: benzoate/H(+) symporter BenE family transporter [Bacillota bacterium]|nr:benzoate/H(+) symporter BenE family transporter [Bacillota bacterium]
MSAKEKTPLIQKGPGFRSGLRDLPGAISGKSIAAGLIATIFGCTGPALVVMRAADAAGYTMEDKASWLFGIYVFGGAISIIMALYYKMPINGAFSIPGAAMLISSLVGVPFNEAAGAFVMAGVIVLILGLTGIIGRIMRWLPIPIVMAMIAGAMIRFGTGIITSIFAKNDAGQLDMQNFVIGIAAIIGFFLLPRFVKQIPPVIGATVLAVIAMIVTGVHFSTEGIRYIPPRIVAPHFTLDGLLGVALPLAVLVIGAENSQAIGVLIAQGYKPPINAMTIISGIGGIAAGLVGAHNANIAGPMTAICSSEAAGEDPDKRYAGSIVNGLTFGAFGLVGSLAVGVVNALPSSLVAILAGLAMVNVLIQAFQLAFSSKRFQVGTFFALVTASSGITLFQIGSSFWALVFGVIVAFIVAPEDFKHREEENVALQEEAAAN